MDNIDFRIEGGMTIEIQVMLRDDKSIIGYSLKALDNIYYIDIQLKEYSDVEAHRSFISLMGFISYRYFNMYITEIRENAYNVEYYTATEKGHGSCFKISYS